MKDPGRVCWIPEVDHCESYWWILMDPSLRSRWIQVVDPGGSSADTSGCQWWILVELIGGACWIEVLDPCGSLQKISVDPGGGTWWIQVVGPGVFPW